MLDQSGRVDAGLDVREQSDLYREAVERSLDPYDGFAADSPRSTPATTQTTGRVYRRVLRQGPMDGFGYSWFDDQLARGRLPRPLLLDRTPQWPGASFGYEALNLVDGRRDVAAIRDILAATVGDAPAEEIEEYLATLARLGVLEAAAR